MTVLEKTLAVPHGVIFINDPKNCVDVPVDTGANRVTYTASCICVWTLAEMDGEATVKLAPTFENPVGELVFEGYLETPGLKIEITESGLDTILSMNVSSPKTYVKIWTNDPRDPDLILVQAQ